MARAYLVLEDGFYLQGESFGAEGETFGEVVFNTSLTGYQEVLTDPSYKGQIVTMTYPLIGNYGINPLDVESRSVWVEGFVVREKSKIASNWRSEETLDEYLKRYGVIGIEGVDTRALTRHIRLQGAMKGCISTIDGDIKRLVKKVKESPGLVGRDLVKEVTYQEPFEWTEPLRDEWWEPIIFGEYTHLKVVVLDCGVKFNILRILKSYGCQVIVVPAFFKAKDILSYNPDGVLLSNGPGDPAAVPYIVEEVRKLIGEVPLFGICFGHQMLGQALGGKTFKLKFGHHGGNHPVMDLRTRKVEITTQNHGFCVDIETLPKGEVELTHINLNDMTLEGLQHKKYPLFSLQYHPEAGPGPHDSRYLFREFIKLMEEGKLGN
ncbi:glutamine-hydrolyzing carbamoyl-phosphate synthase small subunit [Candidatus Calescamantes bacterium]|nr:glutamine-hydrolyzing carbamoyl-phosphate synthase small subunit [Candidatus Calescamantes bacterium]